MGIVTIGVDIGQRVDPTAIAVVEAERRTVPGRAPEMHHTARHLERLALGTPYPEVARRVVELVAGVVRRAAAVPAISVDATGVGVPVIDLLRAAGVRGRMLPVFFTYGDKRTVENGEVKLGKGWLVARMQILLQSGRLHLPQSAEAEALAKELLDYEIRVDENANDRYGAFKVGAHDDLVTALGLAVQVDARTAVPVVGGLRKPFDAFGPTSGPATSLGSAGGLPSLGLPPWR